MNDADNPKAQRRRMRIERVARLAFQPGRILHAAWRRIPIGSFELRCDLDLYPRPHYAYGVQQAALLAKRLQLPAVSVIEFGVAGGRGLLELERMAALASEWSGVHVRVFGFDSGSGLPQPIDYRDLPYTWQSGFFDMDVDALQSRLSSSRLILGDIADTVPAFCESPYVPPVGFVAIDLDYYSSTRDALRLFESKDDLLLPRVLCYFDDIVGGHHVLQNEYVGELAAIREFNEANDSMKITPIHGLVHKRVVASSWCDSMYSWHRFEHKLYNEYVGPSPENEQLRLDP